MWGKGIEMKYNYTKVVSNKMMRDTEIKLNHMRVFKITYGITATKKRARSKINKILAEFLSSCLNL